MSKWKVADGFSNEEGSIARFLVIAAFVAGGSFMGDILFSLVSKEPIEWVSSLMSALIIFAFFTVIYFIARLFAYRIKIFPKIENREALHGMSFIILALLSIILAVVFI